MVSLADINRNPSRRDTVLFGVMLIGFGVLLGALTWWRPTALMGAAIFCGAAWVITMIFNADRKACIPGVAIPLLLALVSWAAQRGESSTTTAILVGATGMAAGLLAALIPAVGQRIYINWMIAAMPIGWAVSHVVLAIIFFGLFTPVGLVMRLVGYDPMRRKFDPAAETYWLPHEPVRDTGRYFRQF